MTYIPMHKRIVKSNYSIVLECPLICFSLDRKEDLFRNDFQLLCILHTP